MDVLASLLTRIAVTVADGIRAELHEVRAQDGRDEAILAEREWQDGLEHGTWFRFQPVRAVCASGVEQAWWADELGYLPA